MEDSLKEKIEREILRVKKLFDSGKPLLDLCKIKEPDFIEASDAGSFLQSFYNGIEGIILLIIKATKEDIPNDLHWHKKLFEKSFEMNEKRTIIFKSDYKELFTEYLSFRHYFRHSYGYEIEWERLKPLINSVEALWELIEEDIKLFIKNN